MSRQSASASTRTVKCVVWDLDNTVWDGVLLEDDVVCLREEIPAIVQTLDDRGILQSIASKNGVEPAMAKLREFGLAEFFLHPQIAWQAKSHSIANIASALNIGLDAMAFVDDQPFEREEVAFALPVLCLDPDPLHRLLHLPELNPPFVTDDARMRRLMYLQDMDRKQAEDSHKGPTEEFLRTLEMQLTIAPARQEDLRRAEELTIRTHQLNTTGYTYGYDELEGYRTSDRHKLLVTSLTDRFGPYGTIGLTLVECAADAWTIKLLLMSCRVMSRGVGTVLVNYLIWLAQEAGVRLRAEFKSNGRNRLMYITYRFANFDEVSRSGDVVLLEHDPARAPVWPDYVDLRTPELARRPSVILACSAPIISLAT